MVTNIKKILDEAEERFSQELQEIETLSQITTIFDFKEQYVIRFLKSKNTEKGTNAYNATRERINTKEWQAVLMHTLHLSHDVNDDEYKNLSEIRRNNYKKQGSIINAVLYLEMTDWLRAIFAKIINKRTEIKLVETLLICLIYGEMEKCFTTLNLYKVEKSAVSNFQRHNREQALENTLNKIRKEALALLNGKDKKKYIWATPLRCGQIKKSEITKDIWKKVGVSKGRTYKLLSKMIQEGKLTPPVIT